MAGLHKVNQLYLKFTVILEIVISAWTNPRRFQEFEAHPALLTCRSCPIRPFEVLLSAFDHLHDLCGLVATLAYCEPSAAHKHWPLASSQTLRTMRPAMSRIFNVHVAAPMWMDSLQSITVLQGE